MSKNEKLILDIIKSIWNTILFILKWLFKIFAFLWIIIGKIENIYLKSFLWVLLTSIFLFGVFFVYENKETLAKKGVKGVICIRFPKSCIKHEIKKEYYSGSGILNN